MKSYLICTAATAILLAGGPSQQAAALDKTSMLSLDLARKMAAGCEAKAKEMSWKMNISIVDSGANQIFFERMDGAYLGSGDIARHKAETSARFPFPTRGVEQLAYGKDLTGAGSRHRRFCRRLAGHDRRQGAYRRHWRQRRHRRSG
jgi:glc operon protein GlcG